MAEKLFFYRGKGGKPMGGPLRVDLLEEERIRSALSLGCVPECNSPQQSGNALCFSQLQQKHQSKTIHHFFLLTLATAEQHLENDRIIPNM